MCVQLECPLVIAAIFICGIGGTFQYGFSVSSMTSPSAVSLGLSQALNECINMKSVLNILYAVHPGAGERYLRGEVWPLPGAVAAGSDLVFYCVYLLPRSVTVLTVGSSNRIKIWQVINQCTHLFYFQYCNIFITGLKCLLFSPQKEMPFT